MPEVVVEDVAKRHGVDEAEDVRTVLPQGSPTLFWFFTALL